MSDLYQRTLDKKRYLEENGYNYVSKWECEFDQECKEDEKLQQYVKEMGTLLPLEPRDAFYGGRTESFTLHKEATDDEKIKYYDVTSLYPFINKTGKVPLGHPAIITENFGPAENYDGLM